MPRPPYAASIATFLLSLTFGACATASVSAVGPICGDLDDGSAAIAGALRLSASPVPSRMSGAASRGVDVTVVSDAIVCEAAMAALRKARPAPEAPRGLYVFRLGNGGFGVFEAVTAAGVAGQAAARRDSSVLLFDESWQPLGEQRI